MTPRPFPAAGWLATPRGTAIALVAGYLVLWAALDALPFQDVPNHLARAVVMWDLLVDGGARFGDAFELTPAFVPYLLGDLLLLPFANLLPPDVGGRLFVALTWASFPLALWAWLREAGYPTDARFGAALLGLYLATDVFFAMGFLNFRLGVAAVLLGLAAWERWLRAPGPAAWAAFVAVAVAAYLTHLSALVFLVGAVGVLTGIRLLSRRARLLPLLAAGLPIVALLAWHVAFREVAAATPPLQPEPLRKVLRLVAPLCRYRTPQDFAVAAGFVASVTLPLAAFARRGVEPRVVEALALAAAFAALYFVLPEEQGPIWAIDTRAAALGWAFAAAAAAAVVADRPAARRVFVAAAGAVAAANLVVLALQLEPDNRELRAYRAVAWSVPDGATLLPVLTQPKRGYVNPFAHAASYATVYAGAVVPYTFTGDAGMPMRYFRFRHRPAAPPQFWYQSGGRAAAWEALLPAYDYVIVGLPSDWGRLPPGLSVIRSNDVAALAAVPPPTRRVASRGAR